MVSRPAATAVLAPWLGLVALAGCHALDRDPALPAPQLSRRDGQAEARAILVRANENARKVTSLKATPGITLSRTRRGAFSVQLDGQLAMNRPRDFRLLLNRSAGAGGANEADLGSNGQEFWFWTRDSKEPYILVCSYDQGGNSPLATALQPDWILEAMGLRIIPDDEIRNVKARRVGADVVLTSYRKGVAGESLRKEWWADAATGRIKSHTLAALQGTKWTPLAEATIKETRDLAVPDAGAEPSGKVTLPRTVQLTWHQPQAFQIALDLKQVEVNPGFDADQAALFEVPEKEGFVRKDLRELGGANYAQAPATAPAAARPQQRSSRPPPPVRLGEPEPIGLDGAVPAGLDGPTPLSLALPDGPAIVGDRPPGPPGS
ncbi:MAG TPA: hypothetical protein VG406_01640 [Isosphaeraceae bacterium]|jgi:hypothetical protein|nr:hypothetical protein [Isosphaeraceae bacterium]